MLSSSRMTVLGQEGLLAWLEPQSAECLETVHLKELCSTVQVPLSFGPLCLLWGQRPLWAPSVCWLQTINGLFYIISCLATFYLLTHKLKKAFPSSVCLDPFKFLSKSGPFSLSFLFLSFFLLIATFETMWAERALYLSLIRHLLPPHIKLWSSWAWLLWITWTE